MDKSAFITAMQSFPQIAALLKEHSLEEILQGVMHFVNDPIETLLNSPWVAMARVKRRAFILLLYAI